MEVRKNNKNHQKNISIGKKIKNTSIKQKILKNMVWERRKTKLIFLNLR